MSGHPLNGSTRYSKLAVSLLLGIIIGSISTYRYWASGNVYVSSSVITSYKARIALYFLIVAIFVAAASIFILKWFSKGLSKPRELPFHRYAAMFVMIMVVWLAWIIPHYPGTMRDDSLVQLFQWTGVCNFYDQHPLLTTVIFGAFWSLGDLLGIKEAGLFLYILVTALLAAATFVWGIRYFESRGMPQVWGWVAAVFFACGRVIYQSIDAMSKDGLNSIFLVICFVLIFDAYYTKGKVLASRKYVVALCISAFLCMATKRTMLLVLVPVLLVAIICVDGRHAKLVATFVAVIPALVFQCVFSPLISLALGAAHTTTYEVWSLPVQIITRTIRDAPDTFSEAELEELSTSFDYTAAVQTYNPTRSDDVIWNIQVDGNKLLLVKYATLSAIRHPRLAVYAVGDMVDGWFAFDNNIDYGHNTYEELIAPEGRSSTWQASYFERAEQTFKEFISQYNFDWVFTRVAEFAESVDKALASIPVVSSYGLYCAFIPLLVVANCLFFDRSKCSWFALMPALLFASVMVGPMTLYWYTSSFCYLAPFFLFAARFSSAREGDEGAAAMQTR